MRAPFLKIAVVGLVALVALGAPADALAKKTARKQQAPKIVTQNSDIGILEMIGSVMPFSTEDAKVANPVTPRQSSTKYLNTKPDAPGARQAGASLQGGGENTPYGFPESRQRDDEIGFYKDNFTSYNNSPLNGYYGWYGQISP